MSDQTPLTDEMTDAFIAGFAKNYSDITGYVFVNVLPAKIEVWRAVCKHGSVKEPLQKGETPIRGETVLGLRNKFVTQGVYALAGQCKDCGRVHWGLIAPEKVTA